jgi:hypothetical protein
MQTATKRRNQWVITRTLLDCLDGEAGTRSAGTTLPKLMGTGKTAEEMAAIAKAEGLTLRFRMLDDDDQVYYEGYMIPFDQHNDSSDGFEPLDDFGEGNAGCTRLDYWEPGKGGGWTTL